MLLQIGALITLLAIAVDPFTQQLVQLEQSMAFTADSQAAISRANRYSGGNEYFLQLAGLSPDGRTSSQGSRPIVFADADFSIQSAFMFGLNQPLNAVTQQAAFECATGNCKWPSYESLAVCSVCNDVSVQLKRESSQGAQYTVLDKSNGPGVAASGGTKFSLPNGLYMDNFAGARSTGNITGKSTGQGAVQMVTLGTGNATRTNSLQHVDTLIWGMSILRMRPDNSTASWPDSPLDAIECGLYYCVKAYNSTVANGTLTEVETIRSNVTRSPASWRFLQYDRLNISALDRSLLASLEFHGVASVLARSDLMLGDSFNISKPAVDGISSYMQTQLAYDYLSSASNSSASSAQLNGYHIASKYGTRQYRPSTMSALWASPDLNRTFQALASSMSNAVRAGGDGGLVQTGMTGASTTYYRIVWPWIALHCAVVLLGLLFLLLTILKSRSAGAPVWKTSALATLSRGSRVAPLLDGVNTTRRMERRAGGEKVRLLTRAEMEADEYSKSTAYALGDISHLRYPQDSVPSFEQHYTPAEHDDRLLGR